MNAHPPADSIKPAICTIEGEQALLGAILSNSALLDTIGHIAPEDFFEPLHRKIWAIACDLHNSSRPVTPITVKPYLPVDVKIGDITGFEYLVRLVSEVPMLSHAPDYARSVIEYSVAREAGSVVQEMAEEMAELQIGTSAERVISGAQERLEQLKDRVSDHRGEQSVADAFYASISRQVDTREKQRIPFPLKEMGAVLSESGFEAGNLYGLLARAGEGKTSLTLQIIRAALEAGHPVQFLSYDQSPAQCARQMAQQVYEIEMRRQADGDVSEKEAGELLEFYNWLRVQPLRIERFTDQGVIQIGTAIRRFVRSRKESKAPLIVVDHIKAVQVEDKRADEGSKAQMVARPLKAFAGKYECAILLLNQRNSRGLSRFNPRPVAADLYGGEPARYDYDAILALYRPWLWMQEQEAVSDGSEAAKKRLDKIFHGVDEETAELSTLKARFGQPGIRRNLRFEGRFTRFHPDRKSGLLDEAQEVML